MNHASFIATLTGRLLGSSPLSSCSSISFLTKVMGIRWGQPSASDCRLLGLLKANNCMRKHPLSYRQHPGSNKQKLICLMQAQAIDTACMCSQYSGIIQRVQIIKLVCPTPPFYLVPAVQQPRAGSPTGDAEMSFHQHQTGRSGIYRSLTYENKRTHQSVINFFSFYFFLT